MFKHLRLNLPRPYLEKGLSAVGGLLGIWAVLLSAALLPMPPTSPLIVASMGASALLLFTLPHGPLSQPWPLLGGHVLSALVGVSCYRWLGAGAFSAALAVGLAIGLMYSLRCLHPPGGATALGIVVGSDAVHQLGYVYLLTPILFNGLILFSVAVIFNYPFSWRRYPLALQQRRTPPAGSDLQTVDIRHALHQFGAFLDVSAVDLEEIYALARAHAASSQVPVSHIEVGHCYSNGEYGARWEIRQVVDAGEPRHGEPLVIYKVLAGPGRRHSATISRADFARWAHYEVVRDENSWRRKDEAAS